MSVRVSNCLLEGGQENKACYGWNKCVCFMQNCLSKIGYVKEEGTD